MSHTKNMRKGTKYFISDHYPHEINERRRDLQKVRKEKISEGRKVKLVADRLYVDDELFTLNLPDAIDK